MKKIIRILNAIAKDYFAPYHVSDCNGTNILCWTLADAQDWLKYCSHDAKIVETYDYTQLVARKQYI